VSNYHGDSRDYILLGGTKELLSNMKWQDPASLDHPWSQPDWHKNKQIIEEYLEYVINDVEKNIANK